MGAEERGSQMGMLEVACALAAVTAVVACVGWGLNFNLIVALVLLMAAYAVLRDLRMLWRRKKEDREVTSPMNYASYRGQANTHLLHGQQNRRGSPNRSAQPASSKSP